MQDIKQSWFRYVDFDLQKYPSGLLDGTSTDICLAHYTDRNPKIFIKYNGTSHTVLLRLFAVPVFRYALVSIRTQTHSGDPDPGLATRFLILTFLLFSNLYLFIFELGV